MAKNPEEKEVVKEQVVITQISIKPTIEKVYSFEQWAQIRGKLNRHLNGMRAWLKEKASCKFTLKMWDELMSSY